MDPAFYPRERLALRTLCWLGVVLLAGAQLTRPGGWGPGVQRLRIDVNEAPLAELCALPGVGPATAAELVRQRPFAGEDELRALLGERGWALARGYVRVGASRPGLPPSREE